VPTPSGLETSYLLLEQIGSGGTGAVWRAVDKTTGEQVAIKLLREDLAAQPKVVRRFEQEQALLTALRHEHIVAARELLTLGGSLGIVLDLVPSGSLRDRLRRCGTLPPAEAASIVAQVASALARAHELGIVHRDLKPDNVLIHGDDATDPEGGGGPHALLTDFGLAHVLGSPALTTTGALMGTPNYLAPEIINGARPSPATDVYALGVLFYELIVGRPPYAGDSAGAVLRRHVEQTPPRPDGIPAPLWRLIRDCTRKNPDRRPSAVAVGTAARSLARGFVGLPALSPMPAPEPTEPRKATVTTMRLAQGGGRFAIGGLALLLAIAVVAAARVWLFADGGDGAVGPGRVHPSRIPAVAAQPPLSGPGQAGPAGTSVPGGNSLTGMPFTPEDAALAAGRRARPTEGVGTAGFGPARCTEYSWKMGHPVLARLCVAVGPKIRGTGRLRALSGVRADVTVYLVDAATGRRAAAPHTCRGLVFTEARPERDCGPVEFTAPRGRRYALVQSWVYTGRRDLPGGSVQSGPFTW
jgi:serine/threonine-protein kinase